MKAAKNGDTVVTTIDVSLQKIVEDKILAFNQAHAGEARSGEPGSKNTAVMIMNPNTGEILAAQKKADAAYDRLTLAGKRLMDIIYSNAGLSNKDKAKFEAQINNLADKWEL